MMTSFGILGFKISISCKPGYKLLKYLAEPISESLSLIVNESFLNGIYLIEKYRRSVNAMVSDSFPGQFLFNM